MCGIHGILRLTSAAPPIDRDELLRTRDALARRGPDGEGLWLDPDGRVGLGHRRLAILDLSDAAAQPMASADGHHRIVFNGEIYNFRALRSELEADGHRFRSTGDTEVILALYARCGVAAFERLRGMYALALWDGAARSLVLARDPFGIKPLYYAHDRQAGVLRFASQVKALDASGAVSREVDPAGLTGFLLWGSVPEPRTIRRAVRALPAGTSLTITEGSFGTPRPIRPRVDGAGSLAWPEAIDESVRAHLVSDVPVAVFLSSGLDSATLAALATRHLPEPPTTFTLRFEPTLGTDHDEGPLAAATARRLGTRHVERIVSRADFHDLWDDALAAMDQPSIDGFNTYVVSRAAADAGLKVVLSGLGGDELLGSYPSFTDVPRIARWMRWAHPLSPVLGSRPVKRAWAPLARRFRPGSPKLAGLPHLLARQAASTGGRLAAAYVLRRGLFLPHELPPLLDGLLGEDAARQALAACDPVRHALATLERGGLTPGGPTPSANAEPPRAWDAVQTLESALYMRNQLLRDADWASMAHSLELRVPFVDAWLRASLAGASREQARTTSKAAVLRRVAPELPQALWTRPKTGFYIPVMDWLDDRETAPESRGGAERSMARDARGLALRVARRWGIELEPAP